VLLDAEAQGVRVPAAPLKRLVDRAMLLVTRTDDVSLRCLAVDALSRAGRPIAGWRDRAAEEATTTEDRAHVALALSRGGLRERAAALLDAPRGADAGPDRERGGLLRSPARARAVELRARMECRPADPKIAELAARVQADALRPERLTTQEQAHVARALARWYAARADDARPGAVRLVVGDRALPLTEGSHDIDIGEATDVRLEGEGAAYAVLELRGRRAGAQAESHGVTVSRSLIDVDTGAAPKAIRRGGVYEVRITGRVATAAPDLLVTDVLPGGFEPESPRLDPGDDDRDAETTPVAHADVRDDRVLFFARGDVQDEFAFAYRVRAVFPGEFAAGATTVEALYDPAVRALLPATDRVRVVR
jgi:uncharacterized protein YfaS (alpha-2-macroglobulin family)